jgi:hypothetical protein
VSDVVEVAQGEVVDPLTPDEERRRAECEDQVDQLVRSWLTAGSALAVIRNERLYRSTHGRFEDYCRDQWGFSRQRANQLVAGAEAVVTLTTTVVTEAPSERVARELVPLKNKPEELAAVWTEVASNGAPPTAARVREAVKRHRQEEEPEEAAEVVTDEPVRSARQEQLARANRRRVEDLVGACQAYRRALPDLKVGAAASVASESEIRAWISCIRGGEKALREVRTRLEEGL